MNIGIFRFLFPRSTREKKILEDQLQKTNGRLDESSSAFEEALKELDHEIASFKLRRRSVNGRGH